MPVTELYAPSAPTMAGSQDFSYHNTDSAEVGTALPHCPLSDVPSAAEGENVMLESIHAFLYSDIYYGLWGVSFCMTF